MNLMNRTVFFFAAEDTKNLSSFLYNYLRYFFSLPSKNTATKCSETQKRLKTLRLER